MLFNSLQFVLFFIAVTCLYFAMPHRNRWGLLLVASCFFYMAFVPVYILILAGTIIIDYFAGIQIEKAQGRRRKRFLILSLIANIGILAVFKYYNFFNENLTATLESIGMHNSIPYLTIALPIGLSFHTFQAMSYTIEVYRGNQQAVRHFGIYSLYVMFYPQLVAGPIERPQNLLYQFAEKHEWDWERFKQGFMRMLWGMVKKVVIADRLSPMVSTVFENPENYSSTGIILALAFFAFQVYCDFSGYSDIAIGAARIMGFKLMENFRTPYFTNSITEYWRRWHISLSTWFRDYVYIPLGGSRRGEGRTLLNLFIVFVLSGFWHGAAWGYVIWGAMHGCYQIFEYLKRRHLPWLPKMPRLMGVIFTFAAHLFAFLVFLTPSLEQTIPMLREIFAGNWELKGINPNEAIFGLLLIAALNVRDYFVDASDGHRIRHFWIKSILWILVIYFLGVFADNQFIYFQF